jgi:hypothetical protein
MARNIDKTCKIEDLMDYRHFDGELVIWLSSPICFRNKIEKNKYITKEIEFFLQGLNIKIDFSSSRRYIQLISIWYEKPEGITCIDISAGIFIPRTDSDFILPTEEFKDFIDNIIEYQIKTFNGKS